MAKPFSNHRVLNLGAGTQSSVLLIMADRGDIEPVDVAVFADTQAEPKEVYDHLAWLETQVKRTRIVRVSAGNLEADSIAFRQNRFSADSTTGRKGYASIPLFVLSPDGTRGIVRRQCTSEYKIKPIEQYIRREIVGVAKGERVPKGVCVTQVFGISFDERQRMRAPDNQWSRFEYPLVDRKLDRQAVIRMAEAWFPDRVFPRSACVFCPYKSNGEWRRTRDEHPDEWRRAVEFDNAIRVAGQNGQRRKGMMVGDVYVHRSCVPLGQADLRTTDEKTGQLDLYGMVNECEGMCGV
jgi:hypothetical protein